MKSTTKLLTQTLPGYQTIQDSHDQESHDAPVRCKSFLDLIKRPSAYLFDKLQPFLTTGVLPLVETGSEVAIVIDSFIKLFAFNSEVKMDEDEQQALLKDYQMSGLIATLAIVNLKQLAKLLAYYKKKFPEAFDRPGWKALSSVMEFIDDYSKLFGYTAFSLSTLWMIIALPDDNLPDHQNKFWDSENGTAIAALINVTMVALGLLQAHRYKQKHKVHQIADEIETVLTRQESSKLARSGEVILHFLHHFCAGSVGFEIYQQGAIWAKSKTDAVLSHPPDAYYRLATCAFAGLVLAVLDYAGQKRNSVKAKKAYKLIAHGLEGAGIIGATSLFISLMVQLKENIKETPESIISSSLIYGLMLGIFATYTRLFVKRMASREADLENPLLPDAPVAVIQGEQDEDEDMFGNTFDELHKTFSVSGRRGP